MCFLGLRQRLSSVELPLLCIDSKRELKFGNSSLIGKWFSFHVLSLIPESHGMFSGTRGITRPCVSQVFREFAFLTYLLVDSKVESLGSGACVLNEHPRFTG